MAESDASIPTSAVDSVCEHLVGLEDLEPWVRSMLRLFPIPSPRLAGPLFSALLRIAQSVPWLENELGYAAVDRLTRVVGHLTTWGSATRWDAQKKLVGAYALAGTMVGSETVPMPGPENLRAALWLCHEKWEDAGERRASVIVDFASAIRNAIKIRKKEETLRHPLARHLDLLGKARSIEEFVANSSILNESEQASIRAVWKDVWPFLAKRTQTPANSPKPFVEPSRKRTFPKIFDEDAEIEARIEGTRAIPTQPPIDRDRPVSGEPAAEVSTPIFVTSVEGSQANPDARRLALLRAQQVVWTQNSFLLTNHPNVLPLELLRKALQVLVGDMQSESDCVRQGVVGLLLQSVTGKTSRSLLAMRIVDQFAPLPQVPCELSLQDAALRMRVYFIDDTAGPTGYFVPSEEQEAQLEVVGDRFSLPLPAVVVDALKQNGVAKAFGNTSQLEGNIREAARHVSERLGISIAAGQLRRSFAAHLYEACRDLALTQLICAETLGQSDAPSHYYAPRASEVADTYAALMHHLLEIEEPHLEPTDTDARVGARLLVRQDVAREMTSSLGAFLHKGVEQLTNEGEASRVHEAMVAQLGCMLLAACGHRPTDALFRLDLGSIDLEGRCALFVDKVHDPAHDPRLVGLPLCVARQIQAYLEHLTGLQKLFPQLASVIKKVMAGKAPLLFGLDVRGNHHALTIGEFAAQLPAAWQLVPLNWGRTWIRTRGVEAGMPAEFASVQLGHLDAVGYPFSYASPTEPVRFVEAISPWMDQVAKQQGWKVRKGLASQGEAAIPMAPLRRWHAQVRDHEKAAREEAQAWRISMKSRMKRYKRQAEDDVLANATIIRFGIDVLYLNKCGPEKKHGLTLLQAESLRDEMFEGAGSDIALGLARADALHRILKLVNQRAGIPDQVPARLVSLRRPVDNAFVVGMMSAVRQVRALRRAALVLGKQAPEDWRDFAMACARTVYALAVFGYCECPQQIIGALERRNTSVRFASLSDAILVQWGPETNQVICFRGLAALALARLAKKYPAQTMPALVEINTALAKLLPVWACPKKAEGSDDHAADLLAMLCETVSVSNRYELSPAARMALHPENGSVSAQMQEQLALLDGDPVGAVRREPEEESDQEVNEVQMPRGKRLGNSRSQYLALCRVIPTPGKDLLLPLTGQKIDASQLLQSSTRPRVIAEVKAQLAQKSPEKLLQPIVRLLATWVLQMLVEGTEATQNPADVTVSTYLTRIGGRLVAIFGNASLSDVGEAELEIAYVEVIQSNQAAQDKAAAAVLAFHQCCARKCGLPDLDLAEVREYLAVQSRSVDASLILATERDEAVYRLRESCKAIEAENQAAREKVRISRQAAAAIPLYAYAGARRSEILGLKFHDIAWSGDSAISVRIRANRSRRLKTTAARRSIVPGDTMPRPAILQFSEWVQADRSRLPDWRHGHAYVFAPLEDGARADGRGQIASACAAVLSEVTGRRTERLHRLRHLSAFEQLTPLVLGNRDLEALAGSALRMAASSQEVVLPRDMAGSVITLGHAQAGTTIRCYLHLPWLLRSRADQALSAQYMNRQTVAAVMGMSLPAVDRVSQLAKPKSPELAWIDHVIDSRAVPVRASETLVENPTANRIWTAMDLGQLVRLVEQTGNLRQALAVMGDDERKADEIRKVFLAFEQRFGRRIIGGQWIESVSMPRRIVRGIAQASIFEQWWNPQDVGSSDGTATKIGRLADELYECMSPDDGDSIKLPSLAARELIRLLEELGINEKDIAVVELPLGFSAARVQRPSKTRGKSDEQEKTGRVDGRYLGLPIKRALGIVWASKRMSALASK